MNRILLLQLWLLLWTISFTVSTRHIIQRRKDFPTLFYPGPDRQFVTLSPQEIPVSPSVTQEISNTFDHNDIPPVEQTEQKFEAPVQNEEFQSNDVTQSENGDSSINSQDNPLPVHIIYVRPGSDQSSSLFDNAQGFSDIPVEPQETQEFRGIQSQNNPTNVPQRPRHGSLHSRRRPHALTNGQGPKALRPYPIRLRLQDLVSPPSPAQLMQMLNLQSPPRIVQITHAPPEIQESLGLKGFVPEEQNFQQGGFEAQNEENFQNQQDFQNQQNQQDFQNQQNQQDFQNQQNQQDFQNQQNQQDFQNQPVQQNVQQNQQNQLGNQQFQFTQDSVEQQNQNNFQVNNENQQFTQFQPQNPTLNNNFNDNIQNNQNQGFQQEIHQQSQQEQFFQPQPQQPQQQQQQQQQHQQSLPPQPKFIPPRLPWNIPRRRPHLLEGNGQEEPPINSFPIEQSNTFPDKQQFTGNGGQGGSTNEFLGGQTNQFPQQPQQQNTFDSNNGNSFFQQGTTNFSCRDQPFPGYYADVESGCQMFHVCYGGNDFNFQCPQGTLFDQKYLVCNWPHSVKCEQSSQFLHVNSVFVEEANQSKK